MRKDLKDIKLIPLNKLLDICDSGTWGEKIDNGDSYPILRSSDIYDDKLFYDRFEKVVIPIKDIERKKLEEGDIIVTKSSGSAHLIGKCAIFDPPDNKNYYFSNFMLRLRANEEELHYKWLYYWLISPNGKFILQQLNDTTSGLRNLNIRLYTSQKIPLPPLSEQKRIAAILDKADEIRQKHRESLKLADEYLRSVFLDMFGDPVTNPKGLKSGKLSDIANVNMGQSPEGKSYNFNGNGKPLLNGPVEFGKIHPIERQWTTQATKLCKKDDILFCVRGATAGRMNIADKEYCIGRGLAAISEKKNNFKEYIFDVLKHNYNHFQTTSNGSTFINISKDQINNLSVIIPEKNLIDKFSNISKKTEEVKAKMQTQIEEAENLFGSLMQRAFRGEL